MAYQTAINTKEGWKAHMGPSCREVENLLWDLARFSFSRCDLCGGGAQGLEAHCVGAAHWKKLGQHFNWRLPAPEIAEDMTQPWVMRVETARGTYFFNHVTGQHGFLDEAAATPAPQQQAPPVDSPTYQPASSPAPSPQQPPSGAAASPPATPVKLPQPTDRAYHSGLMSKDKGGWRRFMEPL